MSTRGAEKRGQERARSLITLWMNGGPSQLETWDPHPGSPIGGPTLAINTSVTGLQIAEDLPQMAEEIQHLTVLRSLVSKEGDHERGTYFVKTGYRPDPTTQHPAIGAIIPHQLGSSGLDIPGYVSLGGGQWPGRGGYLGDQYDAFRVFNPGQGIQNMEPHVGVKRQSSRLQGLDVLTKSFQQGRRYQADRSLHQDTVQRALKMMSSEQLNAFDIQQETISTINNYGDTKFGKGCLVARR